MILQDLLPKIEAALQNTTATPQREAVICCQKYSRDLTELTGRILNAGRPDKLQEAAAAAKVFQDRYKVYFASWIAARGKVKNPLICKGEYSAKKNKKALESESRRYAEFTKFRINALPKAVARLQEIKTTAENAPQSVKLCDGVTAYGINGGKGLAVKYEGTTPTVAAADLKEKGFTFDYEREHWVIDTKSEAATNIILKLLNS